MTANYSPHAVNAAGRSTCSKSLEFTLADVYAHAGALAKLHPNNAHVRDKIRQQLQVLRDLGLLDFLGSDSYGLR